MQTIDRRWIFVAVFLSAIFPLVLGIKLPPGAPSEAARDLYKALAAIPAGSTVICSFDFEPGGEVELGPAAMATIRQLWEKNCKIITMALWPGGSSEARKYMNRLVDEFKAAGKPKIYGVDYVNLGFKQNNQIVLRQLGSGFASTYPTDADGTPYEKIPMLARVNKFRDVAFILSYAIGYPGLREWVTVVNTEYGNKVGGAVTAVSAPGIQPYLASGQLSGLLGGVRGAADYEALVNHPGTATLAMTVQSFVHFLIIGLILLSNLMYFKEFRDRRHRRKR